MNKAIWKSKTFWGGLIAVLAVMFPDIWMAFGLGDDYSVYAEKIQGIIGFAMVVWGRLAAGGVSITGK